MNLETNIRLRGLTLMEIMIVLGLAGIVGVLLIQILVQNSGLLYKESAISYHTLSLNDSVSEIEKNIRIAANVASGYPVVSPTYVTSSQTLVLKALAFDDSGNLLSNNFDYIVITKDASNQKILREMVFPATGSAKGSSNQVLVTELSSINFKYLDLGGNTVSPTSAGKINFVISLSTPIGISSQQNSIEDEVNLRND